MQTQNSSYRFQVTSFANCLSKEGTSINIYNWFPMIKGNTYKEAVENIRKFTEAGEDSKAAEIKRRLPAISPCGVLTKGRKADSPLQRNGIGWADYDHHDPKWAEAARDSLKGMPGILGAYVTARYGLHVFYKIPDGLNEENIHLYTSVVVQALDKHLGYPHDKQVENKVHLCSVSYDPGMFYTMPDKVTDFPVEKELLENQRKLYKKLEQTAKEKSEDSLSDEDCSLEEELDEAFNNLFRQEQHDFSKAQIDDMLTRYISYNPLTSGNRNRNLLKLGQRAFYKRFTRDELEYLVYAVHCLIGCEEYTQNRIRVCLSWGYTHCDKQEICKTTDFDAIQGNEGGEYARKSQKSQKSHPHRDIFEEPIKLSDSQGDYSRVVERCCPYLPDSVYDNLPPFFKKLVFKSCNKRDMDLALMSVIAAAGGFTPKVEVSVRDQDYKTNLFFLGIAPAGSGKSVVGKSRLLFTYLKTRFTQLNNGSMRRYKEALDLWELEKKRAAKQHRAKNYDLEPEPYVEKEILHPAQTSRNALIKSLADNPNGITIITSELDVLNESLNSDCGKHSAELRCLASNEPIESKYLKENSSFNQDSPNGGLSATGTIPQFVDFVGNTHDGMLSRCLIMLSTAFPRYLNWSEFDDQQAAEKKQAYYDAAKEVVRIYDFLEKYPTHVTIPPELRVDLDKHLDFYTQRIQEEGYENLRAIINRCQIHVGRIAAILASIRKVEMGYTGIEIKATKEDMDVAIGIVITLLRHACIATTLLIEDGKKTNQIKNIFQQEDIFNSLPVNFKTDAVIQLLMVQFQYSKANTYKIIKRWVEEKFIIRVKKGEYVKTGKPMDSSLK